MQEFKFIDSEKTIYIVFANTYVDAVNELSKELTIEQIKTIKEVK